jgi:hypothetical protein
VQPEIERASVEKLPVSVPPTAPAVRRPRQTANFRTVERFGNRLAAELGALLELVPPTLLTSSGLGRWLGVNRGTCQRVILAVRSGGDGGEVLRKAPGVEGTAQFVKAVRDRVGRSTVTDRAEAMVHEYAQLVQRLGGSQAKLVRLASKEDPEDIGGDAAPREDQLLSARQAIYQASQVIAGTWCAANVSVQAFRPSPNVKGFLDAAHVRGCVGLRRRSDGLPMSSVLSGIADPSKHVTLEGEAIEGRHGSELVAEFCTLPLPTVISHVENKVVQSIILGDNAVEKPVDILLGGLAVGSVRDPRAEGVSHLTTVFGIRAAARHLVYDFYVHRDMAAGGRVFANALALSPKGMDPVRAWYDKLGYEMSVRSMGPGVVGAPVGCYPRMQELTTHLFSRVGWDPLEYEAWRIELAYANPGVAYTISLHLNATAGPDLG